MTAPGVRAATRVLAVLAVLVGLLAMHGLSSTHHAAAASPAPHAALPATAAHAAIAAAPGASCDDDCADLAVLCLAVLTAATLALLLARRRSSPLLVPPDRARAPAPAPPVRHARGPDPVRELCVSRT